MLVKTMSEEELRVRKNARKNSRLPCPHCRVKDSRVLETYTGQDAQMVRRRRKCRACGIKFTTWELTQRRLSELLRAEEEAISHQQEGMGR